MSREKAAQTTLEEKVSAMQLLSLSREQELQQDVDRLQSPQAELDRTIRENETVLVRLKKIAALQKELVGISEEQNRQAQEEEHFAEDAQRLALAEQARALEGQYAERHSLHERQQKDITALVAARLSLPEKEIAVRKTEQQFNRSKEALKASKADQEKGTALIWEVRELDLRIHEATAALYRDQ